MHAIRCCFKCKRAIKCCLSTLSFSVEDVIHVLVNLAVNKSVSPDSNPLGVLSECVVKLAPSLNALYSLSLSTGSF